ncbi:hypothetical protein KI387_043422, partial [Taxus chinensis]
MIEALPHASVVFFVQHQVSVGSEFDPRNALVESVGRPNQGAVCMDGRQISVSCEIESALLRDGVISVGGPDDSHGLSFVVVPHADGER